METKIIIENEAERKIDCTFKEGNFTSPQWINMTVDGIKYTIDVEDIMDALLPFHAKLSRFNQLDE